MDSVRQEKYAKLIQKELGEIFQLEARAWLGSAFITVTQVRVTPDLGLARAQISLFKEKQPELLMKTIRKHSSEIRKALGLRIGKQARVIPQLEFFHDNSLDYVDKMENLFRNLNIPPESDPST